MGAGVEVELDICPVSKEQKCKPCDPALCNVGTEKGTRWEIPVSKGIALVKKQPMEELVRQDRTIRPINVNNLRASGSYIPWAGLMQDGLW